MWLSLLGPLQVRHDGRDMAVPAAKQRIVLAALLTQASRVVSAAQLTEAIWNDTPPPAAGPTLRNYVKRLRGVLGPEVAGRIATRYPGYQITVGPAELDLLQFGQLLSLAGASVRAGQWEQAGAAAAEALGLCRGAPLADIPSEVLHREEVPRLEQMYVQALE
jgi:DNA-binding SARP family transcriptional activator